MNDRQNGADSQGRREPWPRIEWPEGLGDGPGGGAGADGAAADPFGEAPGSGFDAGGSGGGPGSGVGSGGPGVGAGGPGGGSGFDAGSGPDTGGGAGPDIGGGSGPDAGADILSDIDAGVDEEALRRMLQYAVDDLRPRPDALERLQYAVPARRARRRQLRVGAVAAAVLVGAAVPALVHTGVITGSGERPASAASSQSVQGSSEGHSDGTQGTSGTHDGSGKKGGKGKGAKTPGKGDASASGGAPGSGAGAASACAPSQLGGGSALSSVKAASGTVRGGWVTKNVSGKACYVDNPGHVVVSTSGDARNSAVQTVSHGGGGGLPATTAQRVVLEPEQAYVVKFAFVPADGPRAGCPTSGDGSPSPGPSQDSGNTGQSSQDSSAADTGSPSGGGTGSETGSSGGSGGSDPAEGSVTLTHTPESGGTDGSATTTVPDVCAGTVYYTDALPTG